MGICALRARAVGYAWRVRGLWSVVLLAMLGCGLVGYGSSSSGDGGLTSSGAADADPNAPDADPSAPDAAPAVCPDGICSLGETCTTCADCATTVHVCGNGVCDGGETSTTCYDDCGPTPWPEAWGTIEGQLVSSVNAYRTAGFTCPTGAMPAVAELTVNTDLRVLIRNQAWDGTHHDYDPTSARCSGDSFLDIMVNSGFGGQRGFADSIGNGSADAAVAFWMSQSATCAMLMSAAYTEVGAGFADDVGLAFYAIAVH